MEDDLGTAIASQYVSYYIGGKKKENYFSSQSAVYFLHFVPSLHILPSLHFVQTTIIMFIYFMFYDFSTTSLCQLSQTRNFPLNCVEPTKFPKSDHSQDKTSNRGTDSAKSLKLRSANQTLNYFNLSIIFCLEINIGIRSINPVMKRNTNTLSLCPRKT